MIMAFVAIALVAVLALGGGLTVWLLSRDDGTDTPAAQTSEPASTEPASSEPATGGGPTGSDEEALKKVAQNYFEALNNRDEPAATRLMCEQTGPGVLWNILGAEIKIEFDHIENASSTSLVTVYYRLKNSSLDNTAFVFASLRNQTWCITT